MNLAETASIFFETVVGDTLIEKAPTPEEKLQYRWYDAESAVAFLLNIPTRYLLTFSEFLAPLLSVPIVLVASAVTAVILLV